MRLSPLWSARVRRATVPPLASIFGSGFLIIVPVLERALGALAVAGIAGVCALAWVVGTTIRHNVAVVEPAAEQHRLAVGVRRLERASDLVIVVAYVISVGLYLRIMAQYVVRFVGDGSVTTERLLASAAMVAIVAVGALRGFAGLDLLERVALVAVLAMMAVLGGVLFVHDGLALGGGGLDLPGVPHHGLVQVLLVLGGLVITVQGFETVRYLRTEYDGATRIWACRLSQLVSAAVYIGFVAVATPVMGSATGSGPDDTLLDITGRVVPLLSLPVVLVAVLSQFSAAIADTIASDGNLRTELRRWHGRGWPYLVTGAGAILLIWIAPTFTIVVVASRAFSAYYALQCIVALATSERWAARVGYGALALVLAAIALAAQPAG